MDLGFDGLVLPDVATGAMAELLPRKVALRPVLPGLPTEDLIRWLGATGGLKGSTRSPGFATLLLRAGVSAGLDSFAVDGRTVGNQLVWDIIYRDNKLLINGTDVLAMTDGGTRRVP